MKHVEYNLIRTAVLWIWGFVAIGLVACSIQGSLVASPQATISQPAAAPTVDALPIPIYDGHLHYSEGAWATYPIADVLTILDRAGIRRALVSSTPNEGTLRLYQADPKRFVPEVRPYRTIADRSTWFEDPSVIEYLEQELQRGVYRGIGEFHLNGAEAKTPVIKRMVDLAVERNLILHAHSDETAVSALFEHNPQARVLWAHAGMSVPTPVLRQMLERYPGLWIELSYRYDILQDQTLDPSWRDLFVQFPDRFVYGSDTWTESRWSQVPSLASTARQWLSQLPPDIAEKIASQNLERLLDR